MAPTRNNLPPFRITKLERAERGWTAHVSVDGDTINVDCRYGSWQAQLRVRPGAREFVRRDLHPAVAAALQAKVRPLEKREAKGEVTA